MSVVGRAGRPGHRAAGRPGAGRGPVRRRSAPTRGSSRPTWERAPMLRIEGLSAWYGEAQVLRDVDLDVGAGEVVTLVRPQRRRQDHAAALRHGPAPRAARARVRFDGDATSTGCRRTSGPGAGSAGCPTTAAPTPRLTVAENLTLPPGVGPAVVARAGLRGLPEPVRPPRSRRHQALRRRAADARPRPGAADGRPVLLCDEPTEGLSPLLVAAGRRDPAAGQGSTASPCCWSSRTCTSPPPSPTGTTCSPRAGRRQSLDNAEVRAREAELLAYLGSEGMHRS